MKNPQSNFRVLVVSNIALFGVAYKSVAHAGEATGNFPATLKYVGAINKAPVFHLSFTNETVEQFAIFITDKSNTIYYEKIKGKGLVRNFQFLTTESVHAFGDDEITVVIQNTATKVITTYKILPNAPVEKEMELAVKL